MTMTDRASAEMTVEPLAGALGAEVAGVDLRSPSAADLATIEDLLLRHHVLFFPGQQLDIESHVALGRHFGPLAGHPHLENPFSDHPEIFELAASKGGVADEWHTDLTFMHQPSVMSILHMVTCPDRGGDTLWSNLHLAYEALSQPLQELCDGLSALHDAHPHDRADAMTIHPVVRVHPVTGRKALYVNRHFTRRIVEMSHAESEMLLRHLTRFVTEERFTVRYRWSPGTIAMWDNRCTQHCVLNDFVGERLIQRVTVMGDSVTGAERRWEPFTSARPGDMTRHDRQLRRFLRQGVAETS
ncbi:MAG: TauD/TfdA family dioxygenase [Acidimicrobiia bacterium]|nr:TauD/TfdA family dioxygenase [Acidimicrobiia bacterium]